MVQQKKFLLATILITLVVFCLPAALVAAIDPFFIFHRTFFADGMFNGNDRYQNAGLINSWLADPDESIDTIIIGTSMSQNFPVSEMKNENGINALRLTLSGGRPKELGAIAQHALNTGQVKTVIWEVYHSYGSSNPDEMHDESPLPLYLYSDNLVSHWRYLFNSDMLKRCKKVLTKNTRDQYPLDTLYTWSEEANFIHFTSAENIKTLQTDLAKSYRRLEFHPEPDRKFPNIDLNLIPIVKAHPEVKFIFYFPPRSYYAFALQGNELIQTEFNMRRHLLKSLQDMKNAEVYGFDLVDGIGDTLTTYKDYNHYNANINRFMARSFREGAYQLTLATYPAYLESMLQGINAFAEEFTQPK